MPKSSVRFLLDVNVLVALAFPDHLSHKAAQVWFAKIPDRLWATCPLTQAGFLRVAYSRMGKTHSALGAALASHERSCANPFHEFWPVDIDLRHLTENHRARLIGHNQIADMQLLMLACRHKGQLATFDTGLRVLASGTRYEHSLLIL